VEGVEEHRDRVFEYIAKEDTPRSLTYQMGMLQKAGFAGVDVVHKSCCFAAFGGIETESVS
jgi:tRNA (cmo5U34)-methyltransferase